jgi:hypothetical protein
MEGIETFSLIFQTGFEAHPCVYPVSTEGYLPGVKKLGHKADRSPPSGTEVKNGGGIPPLIRLHGVVLN